MAGRIPAFIQFRARFHLLLLAIIATAAQAAGAPQIVARIDDVVTPRVVSVVAKQGNLRPGQELIVWRHNKEVGRLRVRTGSGICRVLNGQMKVGDALSLAPREAPPEGTPKQPPATPDKAAAPATPPMPPGPLRSLLEARGRMEIAQRAFPYLPDRERAALAGLAEDARDCLPRLLAAARVSLARTRANRVRQTLLDAARPDLAAHLGKAGDAKLTLAPIYPPELQRWGPPTPYGQTDLLAAEPSDWGAPGYWGEAPGPPEFSGWRLEDGAMYATSGASPLVRTDFALDEAELSGEIRCDSGDFAYLVLRSDIIVKFSLADRGSVAVKFGFNNLRRNNITAKCPQLEKGRWTSFKVRLAGGRLLVSCGGKQVVDTAVGRDSQGQQAAAQGHFGIGVYEAAGAFRSLRLTALNRRARDALPRSPGTPRHAAGPALRLLDAGPRDFVSLSHHRVEAYKAKQHPVADGVLTLRGAPYSQFSHKDIAASHFKVSGRLRVVRPGVVWLRANQRLFFGLKAIAADESEKGGDETQCLVAKHRSGNFHSADEFFEGPPLALDQWYDWELEYHQPYAVLRLNGKPLMTSVAPPAAEKEEVGPDQFGISSYTALVELKDIAFVRLQPVPPSPSLDSAAVRKLLLAGLATVKLAARQLTQDGAPANAIAAAILEGQRQPLVADSSDLQAVADEFRDAGNWPLSLQLLKVNYERFPKQDERRKAAREVWRRAQQKYEIATEALEPGDIGLDNILRTGDAVGAMAAAADHRGVWIHVPATREIVLYQPTPERRLAQRLKVDFTPIEVLARKDYLLCLDSARKKVHKVDLATSKTTGTLTVPKGIVLDLELGSRPGQSYFCANENAPAQPLSFSNCRIYALNEERMEASDTSGIGMFLCRDPAGRYLYAGFHVQFSPRRPVDPMPLQVVPTRGHIDHLLRYQVEADRLILLDDRANPGVDGSMIAADPLGRSVSYVGRQGFSSDPAQRSAVEPAVGILRAVNLGQTLGAYDAGAGSTLLAYNPRRPELYIANKDTVRIFDAKTYAARGDISLPEGAEKGTIKQLLPSPDGAELLVAVDAEIGGIYLHRLGSASEAAAGSAFDTPAQQFEEASILLAAGKREPARQVLAAIVEQFPFGEVGNRAAKHLLELEKNEFAAAPASVYQLPLEDLADFGPDEAPDPCNQDTATASAKRVANPRYGDSKEFAAALDDLLSCRPLAATYPQAWLWRARQLNRKFPESPTVLLHVAKQLDAMGRALAGAALGGELITLARGRGHHGFAAYSLLAGIYRRRGERQLEASALVKALELDNRSFHAHRRLGDVLETLKLPRRAAYHHRRSLCIFPSQPALEAKLRQSAVAKPLVAAELYAAAAPSTVVVKPKLGAGAGFFVSRDGLILTNYHVTVGQRDLTVVFQQPGEEEEHTLEATMIASNPARDIALLRIDPGTLRIHPLRLDGARTPKTGERVVAIGNPGMGTELLTRTITEGIISNLRRRVGGHEYIQTSAAVNPGNSGGPLLDRFGNVIGMITLKAQLENVGFAIPAKALLEFIDKQLE